MLLLLLHRIVEINKTSEIVELDQSTTTIKNENISMKIFFSNMEQKHEHEKEATVDEIVKTCE